MVWVGGGGKECEKREKVELSLVSACCMDPRFSPLAADREMAEYQVLHMVDNAVVGLASPEV